MSFNFSRRRGGPDVNYYAESNKQQQQGSHVCSQLHCEALKEILCITFPLNEKDVPKGGSVRFFFQFIIISKYQLRAQHQKVSSSNKAVRRAVSHVCSITGDIRAPIKINKKVGTIRMRYRTTQGLSDGDPCRFVC